MTTKSKVTQKTLSQIDEVIGESFTLGTYLRAIRMSDKKTLVEFAALLGMSKQQLCDIEHQRKNVSPKLAAEYAEKLGYSREQFVRMAIQDLLDRDELNMVVEVKLAA